ncbi:MAG: hypothetical protein GXP62_09365 [Oligoflexia bacterium]|nr:hypothetical protein [Oligoflexia bacterium]
MRLARLALSTLVATAACGPRPDGDGPRLRSDGQNGTITSTGTSDAGTSDAGTSDTGSEERDSPMAGPRGLLLAQGWDREKAPLGAGAGQYRFIVLQESMYTDLDAIRLSNPDAKILAYQKAGGMLDHTGDNPSTGVVISQAEDGHEDWFLHDANGERLEFCDYDGVAAANMGNADYQAQWLENVQERVSRDGFDGVMMDDVNVFPGHCMGSLGTAIAEYPSDEAYGDAVVSFMEAVGVPLMDTGLLVAPNVALNPWEPVMRAQALAIAPNATHILREYWMRWDDSANFTGDNWASTLTFFEEVERLDVGFLALTYGPGEEGVAAGQRYGRASFLLAWDGVQESAWGYLDDEIDPFSDEWEGDIGIPAARRNSVGVGWKRRYTGGMVLVNPDEIEDQEFPLGRTYVDHDGAMVDSVNLEPGSAAILTAAP